MNVLASSVIFTVLLTNLAWGFIEPLSSRKHYLYEQDLQNQTLMDAQSSDDLLSFYENESFPTNVYAEIRAEASWAEAAITTDGLKKIFPNKCNILIDQIATIVRQEVSETLLDGARDIRAACPQWKHLSTDDRRDFYVALVTAMALAESSCNNRAKNRNATDGTAHGLWQSRRPMTPTQGARWVIRQIESQIEKSGLLFWSNSKLNYWAVLNPKIHAHKVKRLLKKIPACVMRAATHNHQ